MRSGEITFKLPDDAMRRVVKLNEKEYELKETMNCPIGRDVTARMFNDIANQLGKTLLTKNHGVSYLMRCGFIPEEKKSESGPLHILRQPGRHALPSRPVESKDNAPEGL